MLKTMLFAALASTAVPALAQPGQGRPTPAQPSQGQAAPAQPPAGPPSAGPTPPPEFIQAAQAFGQCLSTGAQQLPATVTPEAGAPQVLTGCATQKTALETRFEAWISGPTFPEAGRAIARQQFAAQMGQVEAQIADGIRRGRAAPTPTPTPTPAPSN